MSYTLAVGPSSPCWSGPQRLVLQVSGDIVVDVTYHANTQEPPYLARVQQMDPERILRQMPRAHGGRAVAYMLAFCEALEQLTGVTIPVRAAFLRCILAETERLVHHVRGLAGMFSVLGQQSTTATAIALACQTQHLYQLVCRGSDTSELFLPGGVQCDLPDEAHEELLVVLGPIRSALLQLINTTIDDRHLLERTVNVGVLSREVAEQFFLRGPMARAAGSGSDRRVERPYAAYKQLNVQAISQEKGDVHARIVVLLLEAFESFKLIVEALQKLPTGPVLAELPPTLPEGEVSANVEAPHGLLGCSIECEHERLRKLTIDEPLLLDRLLARTLFTGALVDNIVLIALSTGIGAPDLASEPDTAATAAVADKEPVAT